VFGRGCSTPIEAVFIYRQILGIARIELTLGIKWLRLCEKDTTVGSNRAADQCDQGSVDMREG